jgi:hypothetical protein
MRLPIIVVAFAAAVTAPLAAQQHPDFSGTWTLDVLNSPASDMLPSSATMTVVQHGDTIISDNQSTSDMAGQQTTHMVMTTDGAPWKNTVSVMGQSVDLSGTSTWAHDTLLTKITGNIQGNDFTEMETMVLSADHKTMTSTRNINVGGQDQPGMTMVFVKKS